MSFRLFIYYCALCGAGAALLGWYFGRLTASEEHRLLTQGLKGLFLGLFVALSLSVIDALWNQSLRQFEAIAARTMTAILVGSIGGFVGGVFGEFFSRKLVDWTGNELLGTAFVVVGWTLTGLLIGAAPGVFDLVISQMSQQDSTGARRKVLNGVIGGAVGGCLGGIFTVLFHGFWSGLFNDKPLKELLSPSATGFVVLGACIGLLIGLAQVILKEAWLRVEKGFRAGRELILAKAVITVGRAETCDIGLFGDNSIEREHAQIEKQGSSFVLTDNGTPSGTYLNEQRIDRPTQLQAGDVIRVGRSVLRFGERAKKEEAK